MGQGFLIKEWSEPFEIYIIFIRKTTFSSSTEIQADAFWYEACSMTPTGPLDPRHVEARGRRSSSWDSKVTLSWWTTLSCCWSSLLRRLNTVLVSRFLRIAIWISLFCRDSSFWLCLAGGGNGMEGGGGGPVSRFWLSGWYFLRIGFCGTWLWGVPDASCCEVLVRSSELSPNLEAGPCSSSLTPLSSSSLKWLKSAKFGCCTLLWEACSETLWKWGTCVADGLGGRAGGGSSHPLFAPKNPTKAQFHIQGLCS